MSRIHPIEGMAVGPARETVGTVLVTGPAAQVKRTERPGRDEQAGLEGRRSETAVFALAGVLSVTNQIEVQAGGQVAAGTFGQQGRPSIT